jgi:hypothetical protein
MNERIRELATQATRQYSPTYYTQEWIQGFAELIVRECARVAKDPVPSVHDHDAYKLGRKFASIDVLTHFGVEE